MGIKGVRGVIWLLVIICLLVFGDWSSAFQFVVFGDNRDGDQVFSDLIKKVNREKDLSFAVNTGDLVSWGQRKEYEKYVQMIKKLKVPLYNVMGNHDAVRGGDRIFKELFGPTYYSFDYENSHFVILDNSLPGSFDQRQFRWLKEDLSSFALRASEDKKKNIFVFFHKPTFDPSGFYQQHIMSEREMTKLLMNTFERYRVKYVFAGHIHGYAKVKRNGVTYVITGGAGAPLYLPQNFGGFYHYVKVVVTDQKIEDEVVKIYE